MKPPLTILVDHREKAPYTFENIALMPLRVTPDGEVSVRRDRKTACSVVTAAGTLPAGDYSLPGSETEVAVERKSLLDLYQTLGSSPRRRRFEAELAALDGYRAASVLVEDHWEEADPPAGCWMARAHLCRVVDELRGRFPRVHWVDSDGRRAGEIATYLLLTGMAGKYAGGAADVL